MKTNRRTFIQSSAAIGSVGLVGFNGALASLFGTASIPRFAFMSHAFGYSTIRKSRDENFPIYTDLVSALRDLKNNKYDYLLSSSDYASFYNPTLAVFGSLPGDASSPEKWAWVQQNYIAVKQMFGKLGFEADPVGLINPLAVRLSNLNASELEGWAADPTKKLRIGTTSKRSKWFSCMGFQTFNGPHHNTLRYQIELLSLNRLDMTEAFSPSFFLQSIENNLNSGRVPSDFIQGKNLFTDDTSRSSGLIEIISTNRNRKIDDQVMALFRNIIAEDHSLQKLAFQYLKKQYSLTENSGLPDSLNKKLERYKLVYLREIQDQSPESKSLIESYLKLKA
jgi:hypothetical protein